MHISLTFGTLFVPYSCSNCHIYQYLGLEYLVVSSWLTLNSSLRRCGLLTISFNGILVLSINIAIHHLIMIRVFRFSVACTLLYKPLSVGWSLGPSVGPSLITKTSPVGMIRLFEQWRQSIMTQRAPDVVYTALLLPLPNSTPLNLPCIWPCCTWDA